MPRKLAALHILISFVFLISACTPADMNITPTASSITPTALKNTPAPTPEFPTATPLPTWYVEPSTLRGTKIQLWHGWIGSAAETLQAQIDQFNQKNEWGIHVTSTAFGGDTVLSEQITLAAGAKQSFPDLILARDEQLRAWQGGKLLADLSGYNSDPALRLSSSIPASLAPLGEENSFRFSIPTRASARVIFYNRTWANELGFVKAPTTITELRAQSCAAAKAYREDYEPSNDGLGGYIIDHSSSTLMGWFYSFGLADVLQDDVYTFSQPEIEDSLTFLRTIVDEGCAWVARNPQHLIYFANRQALFITADLDDVTPTQNLLSQSGSSDQWVVLPFPAPEDGKAFTIPNGWSYSIISNEAKNQMAAWLFIRWMSAAERQTEIAAVTNSLPIYATSSQNSAHPQWSATDSWFTDVRLIPQQANWIVASMVLEDAGKQAFQTYYEIKKFPDLLKMIDTTITELLAH